MSRHIAFARLETPEPRSTGALARRPRSRGSSGVPRRSSGRCRRSPGEAVGVTDMVSRDVDLSRKVQERLTWPSGKHGKAL